jgi:hypothetical protein
MKYLQDQKKSNKVNIDSIKIIKFIMLNNKIYINKK